MHAWRSICMLWYGITSGPFGFFLHQNIVSSSCFFLCMCAVVDASLSQITKRFLLKYAEKQITRSMHRFFFLRLVLFRCISFSFQFPCFVQMRFLRVVCYFLHLFRCLPLKNVFALLTLCSITIITNIKQFVVVVVVVLCRFKKYI